ncbi:hypothetical protein GSI_08674 [Ganoderma sinense ZZ0214-1]|uniref:Uncharacterized protein n=1 Tax=Ganoderma sinense ZZ0214-1 TaxID=1077348 RepID=A0A2G8S4D6_9APHY|nr:hypothetical protein GSI_08674 [Ganoderma sinense ZZ0214-1]
MYYGTSTGAGRSSNPTGVQGSVLKRTGNFAFSTFLVVCVTITLLAPVVGADVPLTLQPPSEVVLCQPVNLTWTGGTPPYRLDVEPFVDNSPNSTANGRKIALDNTWFLWTPDFPAGSILQISIEGSGTASAASVRATELPSSNSSCLNTTSATPTSTLPPNSLSAPVDQPSATPSPAVLTSSGSVLSKGAIAGIKGNLRRISTYERRRADQLPSGTTLPPN